MLNFGFVTQKRHIIARKHVFLRILRQNPWGVLAVDSQKIASQLWSRQGSKSRMRRNETQYLIWIKLCRVAGIPDIITYANLGDDRFRGFGVAEVKFCHSP